jgi:hypothetical protein
MIFRADSSFVTRSARRPDQIAVIRDLHGNAKLAQRICEDSRRFAAHDAVFTRSSTDEARRRNCRQLYTLETTYRSNSLSRHRGMPDFLVRYFLLSVQKRSWFSRSSSQLSLAVAQKSTDSPRIRAASCGGGRRSSFPSRRNPNRIAPCVGSFAPLRAGDRSCPPPSRLTAYRNLTSSSRCSARNYSGCPCRRREW